MVILIVVLSWVIGAVVAHVAEAVMAKRKVTVPTCPFCTTAYTPLQWSALLALLTGRGRCRQCGKFFRWPRLIGELFLLVSWALLVRRYGMSWRMLYSMVALLPLAMIMVTDLAVKRVPNIIMLPATTVLLIMGTIFGPALPNLRGWDWKMAPLGALLAFVVLRLLVWAGVAIFGEGALGEGDITLATYVGALVGYPLIIEALVVGFLLGGVGALLVLFSRRGSWDTAIAYGPYIILGGTLTVLYSVEMMEWLLG